MMSSTSRLAATPHGLAAWPLACCGICILKDNATVPLACLLYPMSASVLGCLLAVCAERSCCVLGTESNPARLHLPSVKALHRCPHSRS